MTAFDTRPPAGPVGLPAPVVLDTTCGRFELHPDGTLSAASTASRRWWVAPVVGGGWANVRDGHVVVVRGTRAVWRSAGGDFKQSELGSVVMGAPGVAFAQYRDDRTAVFVASPGRPERKVLTRGEPVAWLRTGDLLLDRWHQEDVTLFVRHPDGSLLTLGRKVYATVFDRSTGTALFAGRDGILRRSDGAAAWPVFDLRSLGYQTSPNGPSPSLSTLGDGRIVLAAADQLTLLTSDGTVAWNGRFPMPRGGYGWVGSAPSTMRVDPTTGTLVFLVTRWQYTTGPRGWKGWEGIYSLTASGRLTQLYGKPLYMVPCGHAASFAWRGDWLLYTACEGRAVALDVTGAHGPIDLTPVAVHLPHTWGTRAYPLQQAAWV